MNKLYFKTRAEWRQWLKENHDRVAEGIWLIFHKKESGKPSLDYDAAVGEALCFGWIDSIIKSVDSKTYLRKFTPRKANSNWSALNKKRAEATIRSGRMTPFGLAKINAAKSSGMWNADPRPKIDWEPCKEFRDALSRNSRARNCFERLSRTDRKYYIGWINSAKRPETRARRIEESISILQQGRKLGLK